LTIASVALILLILPFYQADRRWFTDSAFTKSQWREAAAYVRQERRPGEAVLLVSGHAWPVWNYYAPEMPAVRLPELEILDVDAVIDWQEGISLLEDALPEPASGEETSGAWLVQWQDEVVDPMSIVPRLLREIDQAEPTDQAFWQLGLTHFAALRAKRLSTLPVATSADGHNFGDQAILLDHRVIANGDLLLFWQVAPGHDGPLPDLYIAGQTETLAGDLVTDWRDRRLAGFAYPTFRWQPGDVLLGQLSAATWAGIGAWPEQYRIRLSVYDPAGDPAGLDLLDEAGTPLGKSAFLDVALRQPALADAPVVPPEWPEIAEGVRFHVDLGDDRVEAGQSLSLDLSAWFGQGAEWDGTLVVRWIDQESNAVVHVDSPLNLRFGEWPANQQLRRRLQITTPLLESGAYQLELDGGGGVIQKPVTIVESQRNFTLPALATPIDALLLSESTRLYLRGTADLLPEQVTAGETFDLTLVWQADSALEGYAVSVQILDEDGQLAAQADQPLPNADVPWVDGQVEAQSITLTAPDEPGRYQLVLAVYQPDRPGLPRMRLADGAEVVLLTPSLAVVEK
jgi:hypothetical protein